MSGGGQWRVVRHYLSLSNLHAEAERLLQRLRTLADQQHKSGAWSGVLSSKEQELDKGAPAAVSGPQAVSAPLPAPTPSLAAAPEQPVDQPAENKAELEHKPADKEAEKEGYQLSLQSLLQGLKLRTDLTLGKISQPAWKTHRPAVNKSSIQSRTRYLVSALSEARATHSMSKRTEDLLQHVYTYPDTRDLAVKAGAVGALLRVRESREATTDEALRGAAREALGALGVVEPPRHRGPNVLSLDGGGVRGLVAIQLLRHLETVAGRPAHELFDVVGGVSTGAIIGALLATGAGLQRAADMYRQLSREMFSNTSLVTGGARLMWSHAYYDTAAWERLLRGQLGERTLGSCSRLSTPHLALVSCTVSGGAASPHVFRSWGSAAGAALLWHGVRASAAAPTYFHEFILHNTVHQDGGIARNNPAGVVLQEARKLYGRDEMKRAVVVSLGTGRRPPPSHTKPVEQVQATSWREKFDRILESATDTEGVHELLSELLPPHSYFRFNPALRAPVPMDETDPGRLSALQEATDDYIRRNEDKFRRVVKALTRPRPLHAKVTDYCKTRAVMYGFADKPW